MSSNAVNLDNLLSLNIKTNDKKVQMQIFNLTLKSVLVELFDDDTTHPRPVVISSVML